MYSSTYNIPYTIILSEELRGSRLFSAFPFFYRALYFITVLAEAQHWILHFIGIQSFIHLIYILILSFLLAINLQCDFFVMLWILDPCIIVQFVKKNPTRCNSVSELYYSIFIRSSTCFGRHTAHHQEPKTCTGSLWFFIRRRSLDV